MKSQFVRSLANARGLVNALPSAGSRSVCVLMLGSTCIVLGYTCCVDLLCLVVVCSPCLSFVLLLARAERLQVLVPDELTSGSSEALHIDVIALVLVGQEGGQVGHVVGLPAHLEFGELVVEAVGAQYLAGLVAGLGARLDRLGEEGEEHGEDHVDGLLGGDVLPGGGDLARVDLLVALHLHGEAVQDADALHAQHVEV